MNGYFIRIPTVLMRGGTSKGLVLREVDLPKDLKERNKVILRIFGSPDKRQIDGVGGGNPLTSKLALIGPSPGGDIHITYTFGQVSLEEAAIDYKPTCGNMATAAALYALEEGYAKVTEPVSIVRMFNTNTGKIIEAEFSVQNGVLPCDGDFSIDGVPGKASRIMLNFLDSGGAMTGKLLPTDRPMDTIILEDGREFDVSIIDSGNTLVFVKAEQLAMKGTEIQDVFHDDELLTTLEKIRVTCGVKIGLIKGVTNVSPESHALPKISVVAKAADYIASSGRNVHAEEIDIIGRYIAMGRLHQAFAVSGGIALATAAEIPGTIIRDLISEPGKEAINIGHPSGIMSAEADVAAKKGEYIVRRAAIGRTARRIMEGYSFVPVEAVPSTSRLPQSEQT